MKLIWEKWKKTAEKIGSFQTNLILSIIYYILVVPMSYFIKLSNDFLGIKTFPVWDDYESESASLKEIKQQ